MNNDITAAQRAASAYRLSPQQARLAALTREADVYRTQAAVRVTSALDTMRLEQAARRWVRRHAALRVRLIHRPGARVPLQHVVSEAEVPIIFIAERMDENQRRALAAAERAQSLIMSK